MADDREPCLKMKIDSGADDPPDGSGTGTAGDEDSGGGTKKDGSIKLDAEPQPCLFAPIDSGG